MHGCETLSLILSREHRLGCLRMFRVLGWTSEVTGVGRKQHIEELHHLQATSRTEQVCTVVTRRTCFRGVPCWTLGRTPIILTEVLRATSRFLQAHTETVTRLNHSLFLPNPSQVTSPITLRSDAVQFGYWITVIHIPSRNSTPCQILGMLGEVYRLHGICKKIC